jgi:hypothetical protein
MNGFLRPLVLLVAALGAGTAVAKKPQPADPAADSVKRAEREAGGEAIRVEEMQRDGRPVSRIKVLTADGRVRVMQDDPQARDARRDRRNDSQDRRPERTRGEPTRDEDSDPH